MHRFDIKDNNVEWVLVYLCGNVELDLSFYYSLMLIKKIV